MQADSALIFLPGYRLPTSQQCELLKNMHTFVDQNNSRIKQICFCRLTKSENSRTYGRRTKTKMCTWVYRLTDVHKYIRAWCRYVLYLRNCMPNVKMYRKVPESTHIQVWYLSTEVSRRNTIYASSFWHLVNLFRNICM